MAAGKGIVLGLLLAAPVATGCTQGRDDSVLASTLAARLEQLEQRLAMTDNRAELGGLTQRLSNIETRLAALEGQSGVAECRDSTTPSGNLSRAAEVGSAVRSPSTRAEALLERSRRLRGVAEEDRTRVDRIREEFRTNPDPAARRQAMHEMRAWRRAQVEALGLRDNARGEAK
jgi:hypothetical protein